MENADSFFRMWEESSTDRPGNKVMDESRKSDESGRASARIEAAVSGGRIAYVDLKEGMWNQVAPPLTERTGRKRKFIRMDYERLCVVCNTLCAVCISRVFAVCVSDWLETDQ